MALSRMVFNIMTLHIDAQHQGYLQLTQHCKHERDWIFAYYCLVQMNGTGFLKILLPFNLVLFYPKISVRKKMNKITGM
jgi:hypothetical protein